MRVDPNVTGPPSPWLAKAMPVSHPPTRIVPCRKRGYGRDELARIMDFLHARDELVVVKLDRLGRSSRDVLNPGQPHEGLRSSRWGPFGEGTGAETLRNPAKGGVSEQIVDRSEASIGFMREPCSDSWTALSSTPDE